jgi:hypothetical protein
MPNLTSAAEAAGAPTATPPAIYQTHMPLPEQSAEEGGSSVRTAAAGSSTAAEFAPGPWTRQPLFPTCLPRIATNVTPRSMLAIAPPRCRPHPATTSRPRPTRGARHAALARARVLRCCERTLAPSCALYLRSAHESGPPSAMARGPNMSRACVPAVRARTASRVRGRCDHDPLRCAPGTPSTQHALAQK